MPSGSNLLDKSLRAIRRVTLRGDAKALMEYEFTQIYKRNLWQGRPSRSGTGSGLDQTKMLIAELPKLFRSIGATSILDVPCGDFFWMSQIDLNDMAYIGGDVVAEIATRNNATYGSEKVRFRQVDLAADSLPKVDIILCRDGLVHLSFADIRRALRNMAASGSAYLLATTFTDRQTNEDCRTGAWRTLNLQAAPFNFPPPLALLNEGCTEFNNQYTDKSLGLWSLSSIPPMDDEAFEYTSKQG